jgi:hypothetical protein
MAKKPAVNGKVAVWTRIPKEDQEKLQRRAKRERRSLAAVVELILIQAAATES